MSSNFFWVKSWQALILSLLLSVTTKSWGTTIASLTWCTNAQLLTLYRKEPDLRGARFNEFGIDQPELLCPKQLTCFLSIFFSHLSFFALLARSLGAGRYFCRQVPCLLKLSLRPNSQNPTPLSPPLKSLSAQPPA